MEILLLIGIGVLGYVLWKQSRGEEVSAGGVAGGCLGLGCLGMVVLFLVGVIALWLLLQALGDIDISLNDWLDSGGNGGQGGGGGGGNDGGDVQLD
jgi:hypothetical protein